MSALVGGGPSVDIGPGTNQWQDRISGRTVSASPLTGGTDEEVPAVPSHDLPFRWERLSVIVPGRVGAQRGLRRSSLPQRYH